MCIPLELQGMHHNQESSEASETSIDQQNEKKMKHSNEIAMLISQHLIYPILLGERYKFVIASNQWFQTAELL